MNLDHSNIWLIVNGTAGLEMHLERDDDEQGGLHRSRYGGWGNDGKGDARQSRTVTKRNPLRDLTSSSLLSASINAAAILG